MKYLFVSNNNNLKLLLKKNIFFIVIWIFILKSNQLLNYGNQFVESFLGLKIDYSFTSFYIIYYIYTASVFILLFFDIFLKDMDHSYTNIFLRFRKDNWYVFKNIYIVVITVLYKLIEYLTIYFILGINVFHYFPCDILSTILSQQLILLIYYLVLNNRINLIFILFILWIFNHSVLNYLSFYIVSVLILTLTNFILCRRIICKLFERSSI